MSYPDDDPTEPITRPRSVDFDADMRDIEQAMRRSRRGPLRRLALFASGADRDILRKVPSEESTYVRLGTFVVLAAVLAGVGAFVASGFYFRPPGNATATQFPVTTMTVGAGILVSVFILTFDRALVGSPLNSYQFPPEVMEALWNPAADSKWFAVLNEALAKPSAVSRIRQAASVFFAGLLRVVVSLCISFLVAEALLFVVFRTEVDSRVGAIRVETASSARAQETKAYQETLTGLQQQREALTAAGDSTVSGLDKQITGQRTQLDAAGSDIGALKNLQIKEVYGRTKTCATLSTSQQVCSSGRPGDGPAAQAITDALVQRTKARTAAQSQLDVLQPQRAKAFADASGRQRANTPRIGEIDKQLAQEQQRHLAVLQDLGRQSTDTTGVLVRHQAVAELQEDTNPSTVTIERKPPCSGGWFSKAACGFGRALWPGTPMGSFVVAVRLLLISVDLMPIILKLQLVLRRRRAYDAVKAALEERYVASAIDLVDERLVVVGGRMEKRAAERKYRRTGTGASILLRVKARFKDVRRQRFTPASTVFGDLGQTLRRGFRGDEPGRTDDRLRPFPQQSSGHNGAGPDTIVGTAPRPRSGGDPG